jgi:hypothetical protein
MSVQLFRISRWLLLCAALAMTTGWAFDPFYPVKTYDVTGTWSRQEGNWRHVISFKTDGTFEGTLYQGDKVADQYEGKWSVVMPYGTTSEWLHYTYTKSGRLPPGTKDTDLIITSNGRTLTLQTTGKFPTRRVWWRVADAK